MSYKGFFIHLRHLRKRLQVGRSCHLWCRTFSRLVKNTVSILIKETFIARCYHVGSFDLALARKSIASGDRRSTNNSHVKTHRTCVYIYIEYTYGSMSIKETFVCRHVSSGGRLSTSSFGQGLDRGLFSRGDTWRTFSSHAPEKKTSILIYCILV